MSLARVRCALLLCAIAVLVCSCERSATSPPRGPRAPAPERTEAGVAETAEVDGEASEAEDSRRTDPWPGPTAITGAAKNFGTEAALLIGPAEVPLYLERMRTWPPETIGETRTVEGRIVRKARESARRHLGTRDTQGDRPASVAEAAELAWVAEGAKRVEQPADAPLAMPIALMQEAWPDYEKCLGAIVAHLDREDFRVGANVEARDGRLVFALWHRTAFLPENRGLVGNPGGLSRSALCHAADGRFDTFLFWQ